MVSGIFGDGAQTGANLNLAAQLLMGAALLAGMFLARAKRFRAHAFCQSAVVLLNLILIFDYMAPIFRRAALPRLPSALGDLFYALPAAHAALGAAAETLSIYIILSAGLRAMPRALSIKNYKLWMRGALLLWWVVIVLGAGVYWIWQKAETAPLLSSTRATQSSAKTSNATERPPSSPPTATVVMNNFAFEPKELTVESGAIVIWKDSVGRHSVKADDGSFESDILPAGGEFRHRFEREGRYPYYCTLHGSAGGHEMAGVIIVKPHLQP